MNQPPLIIYGEPVGHAVRGYRHDHGLTQAELAEQLGVERTAVAAVEAGNVSAHPGLAVALATLAVIGGPLADITSCCPDQEAAEAPCPIVAALIAALAEQQAGLEYLGNLDKPHRVAVEGRIDVTRLAAAVKAAFLAPTSMETL